MGERFSHKIEKSTLKQKAVAGLAAVGLVAAGVLGVNTWRDRRDYDTARASWGVLQTLADDTTREGLGLLGQDAPFVVAREAGVLDNLPYDSLSPRADVSEVKKTVAEMANGDPTALAGAACTNALLLGTGVTPRFRKQLVTDLNDIRRGNLNPGMNQEELYGLADACASVVASRAGRNR